MPHKIISDINDKLSQLLGYHAISPKEHIVEIFAAILLALATISTAWSAYQATRWSGVQSISFSQATAFRLEADRQSDIANRKLSVQVGLFVQYIEALYNNEKQLAEFIHKRFPPELQKAVNAWLETKPLENPDAPPSPFAMAQYQLAEEQKTGQLISMSHQKFADAKEANQTGDNYILLTVIFASVLFFAGVGTKFQSFLVKITMLVLGSGLYLGGLVVLLQYPIH